MPNNLSRHRYEVITVLVIKGQQVAQTFLGQTVLVFMIKDLRPGSIIVKKILIISYSYILYSNEEPCHPSNICYVHSLTAY